eukprot:139875-Rhodomonas_salina.1
MAVPVSPNFQARIRCPPTALLSLLAMPGADSALRVPSGLFAGCFYPYCFHPHCCNPVPPPAQHHGYPARARCCASGRRCVGLTRRGGASQQERACLLPRPSTSTTSSRSSPAFPPTTTARRKHA